MTRDRIPSARVHAAIASQWGEDWLENEEVRASLRFLSERTLHRSFRENQYLSFDLADLILCKLDLVRLWLGPLEDIYQSVDLSGKPHSIRILPAGYRRCERVGCTNTFGRFGAGRTAKRYCSKTCRIAEHKYEKQGKYRRRGPGNRLVPMSCVNGHSRTPENTYIGPDGHRQCRECRRDSDAKRRLLKPTNPCARCGNPKPHRRGVHHCDECRPLVKRERLDRFNEHRRKQKEVLLVAA